MIEDLLVGLLLAIVSGFIAVVVTWIANSYLARDLEKKKKKYDVKLERYSELYENLELMRSLGHVWNLHKMIDKRIEGKDGPADTWSGVDTDKLMAQYLGQYDVLMSRLGGEVDRSLFEELSRKRFMGIPFDRFESIEKNEMINQIKETMERHWIDLFKCLGILNTRLERSLSRIKVIGAEDVAEEVERLLGFFVALIFQIGPYLKETETLDKAISEMMGGWGPSLEDVKSRLENDLEETL